jgi:hypothetical protein
MSECFKLIGFNYLQASITTASRAVEHTDKLTLLPHMFIKLVLTERQQLYKALWKSLKIYKQLLFTFQSVKILLRAAKLIQKERVVLINYFHL